MRGRDAAGQVRLLADGVDNFAEGEDDHRHIIQTQQVLPPNKEGISGNNQHLPEHQLGDVLHLGDPFGHQRCADDDHDGIDAGEGAEQNCTLCGVELLQIQRQQKIELAVDQRPQSAADEEQIEQRILSQNLPEAVALLALFIAGGFGFLLHRGDIFDEQKDENGRGQGCNTADEKGKVEVVGKEESTENRRQNQPQIGAEIV